MEEMLAYYERRIKEEITLRDWYMVELTFRRLGYWMEVHDNEQKVKEG